MTHGKPSSMNPLVQSWAVMRFSIIDATSESETRPPFFMTAAASWPSGEPVATSALSMSPVESCGRFVAATSRAACVPLPEAGGPKSMMTRRGSVVALPSGADVSTLDEQQPISVSGWARPTGNTGIFGRTGAGGAKPGPNTSPQISPHESERRELW